MVPFLHGTYRCLEYPYDLVRTERDVSRKCLPASFVGIAEGQLGFESVILPVKSCANSKAGTGLRARQGAFGNGFRAKKALCAYQQSPLTPVNGLLQSATVRGGTPKASPRNNAIADVWV